VLDFEPCCPAHTVILSVLMFSCNRFERIYKCSSLTSRLTFKLKIKFPMTSKLQRSKVYNPPIFNVPPPIEGVAIGISQSV